MEKLSHATESIIDENVERLAELFPEVVTEVREPDGRLRHTIDVDALRGRVGDVAEGQRERYQFTWPGKREAKQEAYRQIDKCLRPCPEESVNWDTTGNLYIEGDNLDALKLLRNTYAGKVKMIYIDPPYNTGHDFIYDDDFARTKADYDIESGDYDEEGGRLVANPESNGRFHSDWCSMMYPRLLLARDLLSEDGFICISIDENEEGNLIKLASLVFGDTNFVTAYVWHNNVKGRQMDALIKGTYERILVYARDLSHAEVNSVRHFVDTSGMEADEISPFVKGYPLHNGTADFHINNRPNLAYSIYYNPATQDACCIDEKIITSNGLSISDFPSSEGERLIKNGYVRIIPKYNKTYDNQRVWRWGKEKFEKEYRTELLFLKEQSGWYIYQKKRFDNGIALVKPKNYISLDGGASKRELVHLLSKNVFPNAKPVGLISQITNTVAKQDSVILDFFSGSATTAHAVMQLNAENGGNRKFIMVQLPEVCDEKSEAAKAGYKTICEIGKERIRRAGRKIAEEVEESNRQLKLGEEPKRVPDIGFRVLKIDSSNFEDVSAEPAEYTQQMLAGMADNLKPGRTADDLIIQVMLKKQIELSAPIEKLHVDGCTVFSVDNGRLVACFDRDVPVEVMTAMAKMEPDYAVMRDASFAGDDAVSNFAEIFKNYSSITEVEVI